jgi:hypothetical protein
VLEEEVFMVQKYSKPVVRNLGESITNAEGYCYNGSNADTNPGADCITYGGSALGAVCGFGGTPAPKACDSGTVPVYFGCTNGTRAATPCGTGTQVT